MSDTHSGLNPRPRRLRALSWLAFMAFVLLLTVSLGKREFWTDEASTAGHIRTLSSTRQVSHPPGYFVSLYGWKQVFGDSDLALRAFSIPWAILAFALVTAIGRRLLPPEGTVIVQWLFGMSPFVILYFRMARYYSMVTALALLIVYCAVLVFQEGRWRHWTALGLATAALLGTNYISAAMLAPFFIAVAWIAISRRQLLRLIAGATPAFALLVYLLPPMLAGATSYARIDPGHGLRLVKGLVLGTGVPLYCIAVGETTDPWRLYVVLPMLAAVGIALVAGMRRRQAPAGHRLVAWSWPFVILILAIVWSVVGAASPTGITRYALLAAPLAYLAMAAGICATSRRRLATGILFVVLVGDLYGLSNYFTGRQFLNPSYIVPWREIARFIEQREQPGDIVLVYYDSTFARYRRFTGFINGRIEEPERLKTVDEWPKSGRRLWLVSRHRGSRTALRLVAHTIARVTPLAGKTDTFELLPIPEPSRRFQEFFLRRKVPEAIVTIYLFTPPRHSGTRRRRAGDNRSALPRRPDIPVGHV